MRQIFALLLFVLLGCEGPRIVPLPSSMPTSITPATPPQIVTSLTGPADGDLATAATVNNVFQVLDNSVESIRLSVYGGGIRRRVTCTSNTSMTIQPLGCALVTVAGVWTSLVHNVATPINPSVLSGGLAATTRYWVYAKSTAGTIAFVVSTTASDIGARYMAGNTDYLYVSTFITDSTAAIVPYSQCDGKYTYQYRTPDGLSGAADGNLAVYRVNAGGSSALGYSIPSGALSANLMAFMLSIGYPASAAVGPTGANPLNTYISTSISTPVSHEFSLSLAAGTTIDYAFPAAPTYMNIWVTGFEF